MRQNGHHVDKVVRVVRSGWDAARSPLAASWRRSMDHYGLDPAEGKPFDLLEERDLARRQDQLGRVLAMAEPKLDQLYKLVGAADCGVLLTDHSGIVLDRRCADPDAATFREQGLRPGADWSEAREGTNGIGTCLAELRQVTIHRGEHFLARNTSLSCMDAPIFGADGRILAALDVTSLRADQTERINKLISAAVTQTAQEIETCIFRAAFPDARIIIADIHGANTAVLLAVDREDLVIGASRAARRAFGLEMKGALEPRPTVDLLEEQNELRGFEKAQRGVVVRALARAEGNVSQAARMLGIGRATLYRRMKSLKIEK